MRNRKRKLWLLLPVLALCLIIGGRPARAASYRQITYVNSSDKALIFKFKEFCSEGYTWKVMKDTASAAILTGSEPGGTVGNHRMFKIRLGSKYAEKTKYVLVITGKDKKKSITARYYTGGALMGSGISTTSKDALKASVTLNSGFKGNKVEFLVFKGADSTNLLSSANFVKTKASGSTISMAANIAGSKLANGEYKTYIVLSYVYDGKVYYGQGKAAVYKFVKKQHKVTGLRVSTANSKIKLTWSPAKNASYYKVYRSHSKSGDYKCVASKVGLTSYTTGILTGGKHYYYQIMAVGQAGSRTESGPKSAVKGIYVPIVPGKVPNVRFGYNMNEELILKWNRTVNTTGFYVYYKKASESKYKLLGTTRNRTYSLEELKPNTTYKLKVLAYLKQGGKRILADSASRVLKIKPKEFQKKNHDLLLANGVRPIEHINGKSIYTTRKYSKERKLAFVNVKGYSSNTKYLIWISHYTQQVTIFKGSKGKWKIIRSCPCASGKASTPSPKGVFKTTYKETGWYYVNTKELYVTHWCGRNSFHTRPLYNDGSVCSPAMNRPASHGCARLLNADAYFIYKNIPRGTTVVSY